MVIISAGVTEGHFEGNRPTSLEGHQVVLVLARQRPGSPDTCNPEKNRPCWSSSILINHLFSGSIPVGLLSVPWTENKLKDRNFSFDTEITAATETWLEGQHSNCFLSDLRKLQQRAKKGIELRGEYVE